MADENYTVYMHRFPNDKIYIGITSKKPSYRWKPDGKGYIGQPLIYNAIKKYGWDNVDHFILAEHLTKAQAESIEIRLIKEFNSNNREYGYNIANGGNTAGTVSIETKKKMSAIMKILHSGSGNPQYGKPLTEEHKAKIRETRKRLNYQPVNKQKILCVETGIIYESTAEATRETGISNSLIRGVCYGKKKSAGGFHWQYV